MKNYSYLRHITEHKNRKKDNIMTSFKLNLLSILHIRSTLEAAFMFVSTVFWSVFSYHKSIFIQHNSMFAAIACVVWIDWFFGVWRAKKSGNFETQKALKVIYYFVAYSVMLQTILIIEKGYPSAFWMSDAIIMPIITFQIISILKNMSLIGLIPQGLLLEILKKIDNYKEAQTTETSNNNITNNNGTGTSTNN